VVRVDADVRTDRGVMVGVTRDDFHVTDNGRPQELLYFGHTEEPLDVIRAKPASNRRRVALVVTDNMGINEDDRAVAEFWESDAGPTDVVVRGLASMRRQRMFTPFGCFGIGGIDDIVSRPCRQR
jgi:hypothetical protein